MGCRPSVATSRPFQAPHSSAATIAAHKAHIMGVWLTYSGTPLFMAMSPPISIAATVPLMATTAPTEMSIPRVAITSVMPSAASISGAARLTMSITLPYKWPSLTCSWKKPGTSNRSTSNNSTSAASGRNSG